MRIEVTSEDIAHGVRGDAGCCPIALAICRLIDQDRMGSVKVRTLWVDFWSANLPHRTRDAVLPIEATNFIEKFDAGKDVAPFAFDLNVPKDFPGTSAMDEI